MELYNHQKLIIQDDPKKCGLWLGTGSSKTRIALMLAKGKTLVICPKTQKDDQNWERENNKWKCGVDLTVVSKEIFRRDWQLLLRQHWETVIIDEAHTALGATPNIKYVKRQPLVKTSQLFDALDQFIGTLKPARLYLVTATITKSPMTVWAAAKLLGKKFDFYKWRQVFYIRLPITKREIYVPKNDNDTKERLASVVRSLGYVGRLQDYFDVPEQTHRLVHIELTEPQKKRLREIQLEYPDPIVLVGKKHQIENGVLSGDEFNRPETFENNKIHKILDLADEFPRMVVFARYTMQIDQIHAALQLAGKKVFVLDGRTKDRGNVLSEASSAKEGVFIAQCQVSAGWELKEWEVMVFASMDYSITNYEQGVGRILRSDKIKKNLYIYLNTTGIDTAVYKSIMNKKDFSEKVYCKIQK